MYRYLIPVMLVGALIASSCGGKDDGDEIPMEISISAFDFSATVPNMSPTGYLIGEIDATASDGGNLSYELISESVPGALSVGSTNGRILVAEGSFFDQEENQVINATVEVTRGDVVSAVAISLNIDELTRFQLESIEYFQEIALGFEFGGASQITRKWRNTMKVFVTGSPTTALRDELDLIISQLRELISDGFEIELVESREESNYVVFLGSADAYVNMFPVAGNAVASNWGLFYVNWDGNQYLNTGHMYVDTQRANELEQRHLLREEFTQSLGLARDSERYASSIFQAAWTRTVNYTDLDRELIRLLYHPDMVSGLDANQVETLIREIYTGG